MWDCFDYGGIWVNQDSNFDNVLLSMLSLFNIITTEGWIAIMWNGVDTTEINFIPKRDNKPSSVLFFISFVIIGSLTDSAFKHFPGTKP